MFVGWFEFGKFFKFVSTKNILNILNIFLYDRVDTILKKYPKFLKAFELTVCENRIENHFALFLFFLNNILLIWTDHFDLYLP